MWEFHHHDIYLTSIISTSGKENVALFKGVIVIGERKSRNSPGKLVLEGVVQTAVPVKGDSPFNSLEASGWRP